MMMMREKTYNDVRGRVAQTLDEEVRTRLGQSHLAGRPFGRGGRCGGLPLGALRYTRELGLLGCRNRHLVHVENGRDGWFAMQAMAGVSNSK